MAQSALDTQPTLSTSESGATHSPALRRPYRLGAWLVAGGGAVLLLAISVAVAMAWMVLGIAPRLNSAPLRLPPQHTLWDAYSKAPTAALAAGDPAELGVLLRPTVAGTIVGLRFYKAAGDDGPHVGTLWSAKGRPLATLTFADETDSGWQEAFFAAPVPVEANRLLVASYFSATGGPVTSVDSQRDSGAPRNSGSPVFLRPPSEDRPLNVVHSGGEGFPSIDAGDKAIWVDVVFVPATTGP